jgi:amidase
MARDVAGLTTGMQLLEPGFAVPEASGELSIGRLRLLADPLIDDAIDRALARSGVPLHDVADPGWDGAWGSAATLLVAEAWQVNRELLSRARDGIGHGVASMIEIGQTITPDVMQQCRTAMDGWQRSLSEMVSPTSLLALPTLSTLPPSLDEDEFDGSRLALPVNFAGLPALAIPVPTTGRLPASLQLIGPPGGEEILLAAGRIIEAAIS